MQAQTPADQLGSIIHWPELPGDSDKGRQRLGHSICLPMGAFSATSSYKDPGSGQPLLPNLLVYLAPEAIHYLYQSTGGKASSPYGWQGPEVGVRKFPTSPH